jgi:hypothetical protein
LLLDKEAPSIPTQNENKKVHLMQITPPVRQQNRTRDFLKKKIGLERVCTKGEPANKDH